MWLVSKGSFCFYHLSPTSNRFNSGGVRGRIPISLSLYQYGIPADQKFGGIQANKVPNSSLGSRNTESPVAPDIL